MRLNEEKIDLYKGLFTDKFSGKVFSIYHNDKEIGFIFIELFNLFKQENIISQEGTFHTFILPSRRNISNIKNLHSVLLETVFKDLGLDKLYTMVEDKYINFFNKHTNFKDEKRKLNGYHIFSITKEVFVCL